MPTLSRVAGGGRDASAVELAAGFELSPNAKAHKESVVSTGEPGVDKKLCRVNTCDMTETSVGVAVAQCVTMAPSAKWMSLFDSPVAVFARHRT